MNGWAEFLAARMRIIQECVKSGLGPSETEDCVNISGLQTHLLMQHARELNEKERKDEASHTSS